MMGECGIFSGDCQAGLAERGGEYRILHENDDGGASMCDKWLDRNGASSIVSVY
jgi:hypothetical protein